MLGIGKPGTALFSADFPDVSPSPFHKNRRPNVNGVDAWDLRFRAL